MDKDSRAWFVLGAMAEILTLAAKVVGVVLAVVSAFVLLCGVVVLPLRQMSHNVDVRSCDAFGRESGYEVRFVDYQFWDWDCLARTASGKWISTSKLREVD